MGNLLPTRFKYNRSGCLKCYTKSITVIARFERSSSRSNLPTTENGLNNFRLPER
ncbi:MAG: hypothetical protein J6T41_05600 [Neisseriaceae bacterium]|nr:hypothetical protein [Neisseriaceae bacterium]